MIMSEHRDRCPAERITRLPWATFIASSYNSHPYITGVEMRYHTMKDTAVWGNGRMHPGWNSKDVMEVN